jgi:predicted RND superfamily exporter protein
MINLGKITIEELTTIVKEVHDRPNSDLIKAMDFLREDFDQTKETIVQLTHHLDSIETMYDLIHKEFKNRNNA